MADFPARESNNLPKPIITIIHAIEIPINGNASNGDMFPIYILAGRSIINLKGR